MDTMKVRGIHAIIFACSKWLILLATFHAVGGLAYCITSHPEKYISHAGGKIKGLKYTNSKEALDNSFSKGYRFIELDFEWTRDNELVLIHDWGQVITLFNKENREYSFDEYRQLKMTNGLTQMTLDDLATWLVLHPEVYVVTDIKRKNIEGLTKIANKYPKIINQIIPQIYIFQEYLPVVKLGYQTVILTLYMSNYTDEQIVRFCNGAQLLAVTMPNNRGLTELPRKLKDSGVFVYTHTVNTEDLENKLRENFVNGFYTDVLLP